MSIFDDKENDSPNKRRKYESPCTPTKTSDSTSSCHSVIPLLTSTSISTPMSDPTKTSKPTSTSPLSTSKHSSTSSSTTTSPTSKSPKSSTALISNPLRDSISNYIESFMQFKGASIELTESIKQGFVSEVDGTISKDLAKQFKEELRPLIKDKIYSRLPNLYQLLINEQVNVNNIQAKLSTDDDANSNDDLSDNDLSKLPASNDLYALTEEKLIRLIRFDKCYFKKYKKSVRSKITKIVNFFLYFHNVLLLHL